MTRAQIFSRLSAIPKNPKKVFLLTHTDLDGAGAAVLTNLAFPSAKVEVQHCNNSEMSSCILTALREHGEEYDLILATDISLSETDAAIADEYIHNNFLLFDHHPTAMQLNQYIWACVYDGMIEDSSRAAYFDMQDDWHTSATGLLFDYLAYHKFECILTHPRIIEFAYSVSAYDTWDWKTTNCKKGIIQDLNSLCAIYGLSRFEQTITLRISTDDKLILPIDRVFFEIEQDKVDSYISKIKNNIVTGTVKILGRTYTYAGCVSTAYVAPVFEYLRDNYPDCDVLIVNTGASVSMRKTKSDIDLAVVAKHFGGGGHAGASGFPISTNDINRVLEMPFSEQQLDDPVGIVAKTSVFGKDEHKIQVNIEETSVRSFVVEATSIEEAEDIAKAMYAAGQVPSGIPGIRQMQIDDDVARESTSWFEF